MVPVNPPVLLSIYVSASEVDWTIGPTEAVIFRFSDLPTRAANTLTCCCR